MLEIGSMSMLLVLLMSCLSTCFMGKEVLSMGRMVVLDISWKTGFMGRLLEWLMGRLVLYPMSSLEVLSSWILC
jgi:hypothetical protein